MQIVMTPKEKAKELVLKYYLLIPMNTISFAKQCALIAVDEILNLYWLHDKKGFDYWQEVKQEIEKL